MEVDKLLAKGAIELFTDGASFKLMSLWYLGL